MEENNEHIKQLQRMKSLNEEPLSPTTPLTLKRRLSLSKIARKLRIQNKERNISIENLFEEKSIEEQAEEQSKDHQESTTYIKLMAVNDSTDNIKADEKKITASKHPSVRTIEKAQNEECEENLYTRECLNHERRKNIIDSKTLTQASSLTKKYGKHGPAQKIKDQFQRKFKQKGMKMMQNVLQNHC